jgi:hypothetical protein
VQPAASAIILIQTLTLADLAVIHAIHARISMFASPVLKTSIFQRLEVNACNAHLEIML